MKNGDVFYTYNLDILHVIKMCLVEEYETFVSCVEVYGSTTHNQVSCPKYAIYSTPKEAYKALKVLSGEIIDNHFDEDYKPEESEEKKDANE